MESKRRGLFTKSKLVKSLYNRTAHNGKRNKLTSVEPMEKINNPTDLVFVNQDKVYPQQKAPKVAYVVPDRAGRLENFQGLGAEDEAAAKYISNVQERFRLECVKLEEMQLVRLSLTN